jgi:hypothetical protein
VRKRKIPLFHLDEMMQIEPMSNKEGLSARLVGLKLGHYLILELSNGEFKTPALEPNDAVWVRYPPSMVFRFRSKILNLIHEPTALAVIKYPACIEETNFRRSERKKIFLPSEFLYVQKNGNRRSWEGYILDISDSGCFMWDDSIHVKDCSIWIRFRSPWKGNWIQTKARVVRREITDTGICNGLKFFDMDQETRDHLREFVHLTASKPKVRPGPDCFSSQPCGFTP